MESQAPPHFSPETPEHSDNANQPAVTYTNNSVSESKKKKKKFSCPYIFMNGLMAGLALFAGLFFSGMMIAIYPENATNNTYFFNIITFIIGVFSAELKNKNTDKKKRRSSSSEEFV